ncbi:arylsulfotransferase family protein [Defluviimonas sp. SAOS-178_SWC]|uniref:arylsulfotransferase family protein n=1 Tax=Defluviimonas sp. SAOS-178_SWC TaxID=3121287 RepID=UPI003221807E
MEAVALGRSVPLWVFLLCLILWLLLTVLFGGLVKSKVSGSELTGPIGNLVVKIASFPSLTARTLAELAGIASGGYRDEAYSVERDADADYSGFAPIKTARDIALQGLLLRADSERASPGWRVLVGAFAIDGEARNAALLISPELEVAKVWPLQEVATGKLQPRSNYKKFPHGFEILRDGSFIYTFDGSVSVQHETACGDSIWATDGRFTHTITLDDRSEYLWSLRDGTDLVQIAVADGSIKRDISVQQIIDANPEVDILELRRAHGNDPERNRRNTTGFWLPDSLHLNDVEPLPAAFAPAFPSFKPGDLLVSARELNLLFVLDPETLRFRWWQVGLVIRQHDPDWLPNGEILVFNNRMARDYSDIVAINPQTNQRRVVFDGRKNNFYSRIRGKVQKLEAGGLVVTSPQQGRAFEVDSDGRTVLDIVNTKPDDASVNYVVSEMKWLPPNYFDGDVPDCLAAISDRVAQGEARPTQ